MNVIKPEANRFTPRVYQLLFPLLLILAACSRQPSTEPVPQDSLMAATSLPLPGPTTPPVSPTVEGAGEALRGQGRVIELYYDVTPLTPLPWPQRLRPTLRH
ncbi:MAG: hypothetical protein ACOC9E_05135 [Chloroflexota bacterium]